MKPLDINTITAVRGLRTSSSDIDPSLVLPEVAAARGLVEAELLFKPALMLLTTPICRNENNNIIWKCMQAFKEVSPVPESYLDLISSLSHMQSAPGRIQSRNIFHRNKQRGRDSVNMCWEKLE